MAGRGYGKEPLKKIQILPQMASLGELGSALLQIQFGLVRAIYIVLAGFMDEKRSVPGIGSERVLMCR